MSMADDGGNADGHWPLLVLWQADAARRAVLQAAFGAGPAGPAAALTRADSAAAFQPHPSAGLRAGHLHSRPLDNARMTRTLALDPSMSRTGWAFLVDHRAKPETMLTGSFKPDSVEHFCELLVELVGQTLPDFLVWERARTAIIMYQKNGGLLPSGGPTPNAKQLLLPMIDGAIRMLAVSQKIAHDDVPAPTWRKVILGQGNLSGPEAKTRASTYCTHMGIKAQNHDVAEAAMICLYASHSPKLKYHLAAQQGLRA
jgi:hypothetical protein